jgi:hypothetical protein
MHGVYQGQRVLSYLEIKAHHLIESLALWSSPALLLSWVFNSMMMFYSLFWSEG